MAGFEWKYSINWNVFSMGNYGIILSQLFQELVKVTIIKFILWQEYCLCKESISRLINLHVAQGCFSLCLYLTEWKAFRINFSLSADILKKKGHSAVQKQLHPSDSNSKKTTSRLEECLTS